VNKAIGREYAETVALQALAWLLQADEHRVAFLSASGLSPDDLGRRASEPEILLAVIDFVLGDDARVMAFSDTAALPYGALMAVRAALPGGMEYNWT
jgi:hypothetical protein